ncbi:ATP-binding cassette domain-containing protein [Hyphomicrobium sp.]|uniref:ATP-binding cassette domain-containing protein n=1 Tax=Hyphomicrobium sp. TaxID=82 RepID=UPI0025C0FFD9|nr:ATP-binding cassette domain-containing protein [Hyphomicrobium sp.]
MQLVEQAPQQSRGLIVSGVRKSFGGLKVLRGVDLACEPGEIVGLIGPNGAGKSTLINAITSLMPVDEGHVAIAGQSSATPLRNIAWPLAWRVHFKTSSSSRGSPCARTSRSR